jgi:hypothetical protein
MNNRPAILEVGFYSTAGNPHNYVVGKAGITEIKETEECGEYASIPWVEVYAGNELIARFCQHKLEHIYYAKGQP